VEEKSIQHTERIMRLPIEGCCRPRTKWLGWSEHSPELENGWLGRWHEVMSWNLEGWTAWQLEAPHVTEVIGNYSPIAGLQETKHGPERHGLPDLEIGVCFEHSKESPSREVVSGIAGQEDLQRYIERSMSRGVSASLPDEAEKRNWLCQYVLPHGKDKQHWALIENSSTGLEKYAICVCSCATQ
jgi:hypothetical protein